MNKFNTEPVALSAAILAVATAVLALLVQLDVIDPDLSPAILAVVAAVIGLVGAVVRRFVSPAVDE